MTALALTFHAFRLYWSFAFLVTSRPRCSLVSPSVHTVAASTASRVQSFCQVEDLDALSDQRHEDPFSFRLLTKRRNPSNGVAQRAGIRAQVIRLGWISQPNLRRFFTTPARQY